MWNTRRNSATTGLILTITQAHCPASAYKSIIRAISVLLLILHHFAQVEQLKEVFHNLEGQKLNSKLI